MVEVGGLELWLGVVTPGTCSDVPSAGGVACVCARWCVFVYVWVSLWFEVQG